MGAKFGSGSTFNCKRCGFSRCKHSFKVFKEGVGGLESRLEPFLMVESNGHDEDAISEDAWDAVSDGVYDAAREAAEEYGSNSDGVEETVSELLRQYNDISVGNHCTIGTRATELVTKVIQWHLDTSADEGGLLSPPDVSTQIESASEGLQRVTVLEDKVAGLAEENALLWVKVNELTGMVSRLIAESHGYRAKHDTPEGTLAYAESTLKHILMAVQDARDVVRIAEPF